MRAGLPAGMVAIAAIDVLMRLDLDRGDFFAHVREEVELSRDRQAHLLMPLKSIMAKAEEVALALERTGPSEFGPNVLSHNEALCELRQRCAELAALAIRLGAEGTPAYPFSMPYQQRGPARVDERGG